MNPIKSKPVYIICLLAFAITVLSLPLFGVADTVVYRSPYDTAYSADGTMLAVSDATAGELVIINPSTGMVVQNIVLDGEPRGVAWNGNTLVYAAEYGAGTVAEIDPSNGNILRRFTVGCTPSGLAYVGSRGELLVADKGLNKVYVIDVSSGTIAAEVPVVYAPEAVDVKSDGSVAVVANSLPYGDARDTTFGVDVSFIDLATNTVLSNVRLPQGSSNLKDVKISVDGTKVFATHTLGRVNVTTTQVTRGWTNTNALSILDLQQRSLYATVLLDGINGGAADPWGIVQSADGSTLWVSISGTHQVGRINLTGLFNVIPSDEAQREALKNSLTTLRGNELMKIIQLPGQGPRGIDLVSDQLAVGSYFAGKVYFVDTSSLEITDEVALGTIPEEGQVRRGERTWHDASTTLQQWLSCATCHPDARSDGLNWDLMNDGIGNPKNSKGMLYSIETPPVMATGIRKDAYTAINAGFLYIKFVQPTQADKDTVAAYLSSLRPEPNPYLASGGILTPDAVLGKALFFSSGTSCSTCHSGPYFTDLNKYDVGTRHPLDSSNNDLMYDTPTLLDLWRTAPYLHDGSAATLRDVLTVHNAQNLHGSTSQLTSQQIDQLVAYLLQINGTDPQ